MTDEIKKDVKGWIGEIEDDLRKLFAWLEGKHGTSPDLMDAKESATATIAGLRDHVDATPVLTAPGATVEVGTEAA